MSTTLQNKFLEDKQGVKYAPITTPGAVRWPNGDDLDDKLGEKASTSTTVNGHALSSNVSVTKSDVGLGNVGNFKAVSTVASQGLTDTEKSNARANIGAGTSSFSGSYNDLSDKPTIPAAAANGKYTVKTLVGSTTTNVSDFTANQSSADDVTFVQGSNVTITPDATNRKITIAAKDTTYSAATTSAAGLMSAADKTKLNGLPSTSIAAAQGDTTLSLVTADEKYNWNNSGSSSRIDYTTTTSDIQNIDATIISTALRKTAQTLTAAEKTQVKTNLGITISTAEPTSSDGEDGDIWLVYDA